MAQLTRTGDLTSGPLLKKMQAAGLITRRRDAADERSVLVAPTAAGDALKIKAQEIPGKMMQCIPLSEQDAKTLYRLLYQVLRSTATDCR